MRHQKPLRSLGLALWGQFWSILLAYLSALYIPGGRTGAALDPVCKPDLGLTTLWSQADS